MTTNLFVIVEVFLGSLVHLLQTLAHHVVGQPFLAFLVHTLGGALVTHVGQVQHLHPEAPRHLLMVRLQVILVTFCLLLLEHTVKKKLQHITWVNLKIYLYSAYKFKLK